MNEQLEIFRNYEQEDKDEYEKMVYYVIHDLCYFPREKDEKIYQELLTIYNHEK